MVRLCMGWGPLVWPFKLLLSYLWWHLKAKYLSGHTHQQHGSCQCQSAYHLCHSCSGHLSSHGLSLLIMSINSTNPDVCQVSDQPQASDQP